MKGKRERERERERERKVAVRLRSFVMSLLLQLRRRFWLAHSFFRSMNYNPVVVNPEHLFGKKMERAQGELEEVVFKHWNPINTEFESAMGNLDKIITKNMYFDFKIPSLKFSKDVTPRKTFEEIGFKWLVDKNFGIGCFKVTDNTMFDPEYSKVLYGLHGSGEILLAKHLFMNFANEPSKVLTTSVSLLSFLSDSYLDSHPTPLFF